MYHESYIVVNAICLLT